MRISVTPITNGDASLADTLNLLVSAAWVVTTPMNSSSTADHCSTLSRRCSANRNRMAVIGILSCHNCDNQSCGEGRRWFVKALCAVCTSDKVAGSRYNKIKYSRLLSSMYRAEGTA